MHAKSFAQYVIIYYYAISCRCPLIYDLCGQQLLPRSIDDTSEHAAPVMTLALPGFTIPWSQIIYLWIGNPLLSTAFIYHLVTNSQGGVSTAVLISGIWHELGHALAAATHNVRTQRIGFFWVILSFL
jgi:hypothetical protein